MKIKLEMELEATEVLTEDIKEELKQMLFEVCEDWVLKGQEPDLDFD